MPYKYVKFIGSSKAALHYCREVHMGIVNFIYGGVVIFLRSNKVELRIYLQFPYITFQYNIWLPINADSGTLSGDSALNVT